MKTMLKIITLPIWLPLMILWFVAKLIAFVILLLLVGIVIVQFF